MVGSYPAGGSGKLDIGGDAGENRGMTLRKCMFRVRVVAAYQMDGGEERVDRDGAVIK